MCEPHKYTSVTSPKTVLVKIEIPITVLFNYDNHWPPYQGDHLENNENYDITPPKDAWFTADVCRRRRSFEHNIDPEKNNPDMFCNENSGDAFEIIRDDDDDEDIQEEEETPECSYHHDDDDDAEMTERRSKSNIWRWKQVLKQKGFRKIQSELNNAASNDNYQSNLASSSRSPVPSANDDLGDGRLPGGGKRWMFRNVKDSKRTNAALREDNYGLVTTSSSGMDTCCVLATDEARTFSTPSLFVESLKTMTPDAEALDESVKRDVNGAVVGGRKLLIRPSSAEGPKPRVYGNETLGTRRAASTFKARRIVVNGCALKRDDSKTLMKSKSVETDVLITDPRCDASTVMGGAMERNANESCLRAERLSTPIKRSTSTTHAAGSRSSSKAPEIRQDAAPPTPDQLCRSMLHDQSSFSSEHHGLVMKFKTVDFDTGCALENKHCGDSMKKCTNLKTGLVKQKSVNNNNGSGSAHVSNKLIKHVINDLVADVIKDLLGDVIKTIKTERRRRPKDLVFTRAAEFCLDRDDPVTSLSRTTIVSKPDWLKCRSLPASLKPDVMLNTGGVNGLQYHASDVYSQLVENVTPTFIVGGECTVTHLRQLNIYGLGSATRVSPPRRDLAQPRRPSRVMDEVKALTHRLGLLPNSTAGVSTSSVKRNYSLTPPTAVVVGLSNPGDAENLSLPMGGTLKHADSTDSGVESESYRGLDKVIADITADILDIHEEGEALATQLLALCRDIQHYKFQRYYQLHHDRMQAAMDEDEDQKTELGQQLIDLIPQRFCETLRPWGVTRSHLRQRRFSIF